MRQAIFYHGRRKISVLFLSISIGTLRLLIGGEIATLKRLILARMQTQYLWQEGKIGGSYTEKHFINILFVMANSEHLCFSGGDCCVFVDVR